MTESPGLHLFQGVGIEIEYAIVDRESLSVAPVADRALSLLAGEPTSEADLGKIAASNELVLHVLELKTNGPAPALEGLAESFNLALDRVQSTLIALDACLMPTAMHPFMNPATESRLWPHEQNEIYETFDKLFSCRGHGWSNLQSVHINLPFQGDEEFAALHAAIRLILPILPALAASSPIVEGRVTGLCDNRLEFYRHNADRIPCVTGRVIPEPAFTRAAYEDLILQAIARDIAAYDPDGILDPEWTNSRGAIARFTRDSIEIRVLDTQECASADLAVAEAVVRTVQALVAERWGSRLEQQGWAVAPLADWFVAAIRDGGDAIIEDAAYLRALGLCVPKASMHEVWAHLISDLGLQQSECHRFLELIVQRGCLARRIQRRLGRIPEPESILEVYRELCDCLAHNRAFA